MRPMKRATERRLLGLFGCIVLFGILWLGTALGCDEQCGGPRPSYPYTVVERR